MAASKPINCMVTQAGLDARADAFGVPVERLPPPDGLLRPGDTYTSTSACAKGDLITQTSATGTTVKASGGGSPLVAVLLVCVILVIAGLIAYYAVKRSRFLRHEREAFLEAELREDHYRGRL